MYMEQQASLLKSLIQRPQEYLVGLGVVTVLAVMVMPIPPFLLDLFLSFSITFALIILLVSVFMRGPFRFFSISVTFTHCYINKIIFERSINAYHPFAW